MASETTGNEQQDEILAKSKSKGLNTGTKGKKGATGDITGNPVDTRTSGEILADQIQANRAANQYTGPFGVPTPVTGAMNFMAGMSTNNMAKALRGGGVPVYSTGTKNGVPQISVGYNENMSAKDLVGVQHQGLFGGTVYSGRSQYNPANFDSKGNYKDPFDSGDNDDGGAVSALGSAKPATAPMTQTKAEVTQFAQAVNRNPQEQLTKVRKPKAAGGDVEAGGALVRRTKTLQSNRRGILGRPDSTKKTLLGS